jgi:hypothetical protein
VRGEISALANCGGKAVDPADATWLIPWQALSNSGSREGLAQELHREMGAQHVLSGVCVGAVGKRQDCDDVLFEMLDGTGRLAVVHLTYSKGRERDPLWPSAEIFRDWEDFVLRRMQPDHDDWTE